MKNKPNKEHSSSHFSEDEIDLIALAKILWKGRKTIIKSTIIFTCVGFFMALTSPTQYTSTIVIKPILSNSKTKINGSLGGLAAMAGINIGDQNSSVQIHPTLYPKIIESYKFQKELMNTAINIAALDDTISYHRYYEEYYEEPFINQLKKYTLGLPTLLISTLKTKTEVEDTSAQLNLIKMTSREFILSNQLRKQVSIEVNEKGGYVDISSTMPEAVSSTQMVQSAQSLLQKYVIDYKLKKAQEDLVFVEERLKEKRFEFEKAQNNLAIYRDANKNVNTAIASTEEERLESEYQLAFSVYSELAKQVETQKIHVKENTPVFAVLQEAVVPLNKTQRSKLLVISVWIILGAFIGVILISVKLFIENIKLNW